jgi:hypothetical protein
MAAYPSYPILVGSTHRPEKSWKDTTSSSGVMHSRQLRGKNYSEFSLLHHLTGAEFQSLLAVYEADPDAVHTLTYRSESPSITYSVEFIGP